MNTVTSVIYSILEWITRFAYINVLWILFSLAGGIIFGFFPSTISMFSIMRDWLRGNTEAPLFNTFCRYFKKEFWKSNRLGLFIMAIVLLIGLDLWYIQISLNELLSWTYTPLFAFMVLFLIFLFYLFPSFVHFDLKVTQIIKNALFIMLISPLHTLLVILCLGSLYVVMTLVPALVFIFGGSSYAFVTMWLSLDAFNKIQRKQAY
ncbi:YesL family protein [Bacillus fonticola]|uniref:YesL family protein n=1 Tax=Bacillus fonticola TaxID=2728853 RepID=UPI0014757FFB|nr:DUF624 domain-containing protein [Bacillus fonticola]